MNGNFLQSLAQNIGGGINAIEHAFSPQQPQMVGRSVPAMAPSIQQHMQPAPIHSYTPAQYNQMIPVGQQIPQSYLSADSPQLRALSQIYNANPQDPRVAHIDPRIFGYAPDGPIQHTVGNPTGNNFSTYQDPQSGINSVSARAGQYGGTLGTQNGHPFGSINQNGQQIDPIAALRGLLGL